VSREARVNWGSMEVFFSFVIKSVVFSRLYVLGSGARCLIFWVNSLASFYAGAPRQLTTGRMGCSGLCSLISPFMVSAVGFMFMYFHLVSGGMSVLLLFITFQTWDWKVLVGSCVVVWNLLASMKLLILESYCFMGRITREFPLSARVTMASIYFRFRVCVVCGLGVVFLYQGTYTLSCQFSVDFSVCEGEFCDSGLCLQG